LPIRVDNIRVAILISSPIDKYIDNNFDQITKYFSKFEVELDCYYISKSSLQELDNYDYIFIFTMVFQDKLLIEDSNLKSEFITLMELEQNIAISNIKGIFICTEKLIEINYNDISLPIAIITDSEMSTMLFKLFKKENMDLFNNCNIYNKDKFLLTKLSKGTSTVNLYSEVNKNKLSEYIEGKSLINFVGREIDLEDIVRKILETNGRILTVKGSGGIGKTTTVKKACILLFNRGIFNDGISFVDCEFISDYINFEYRIAQCFGLESTIELRNHLIKNQLKQNKLIILDNFETLLYVTDKEKIMDLVTFICDYSKIVITSREWLGFEFENKHELRALTADEAFELFCKYYSSHIDKAEKKVLQDDVIDKLLNNNPLAIKIVAKNLPKFKRMSDLRDDLEADFFNIIQQNYEDIFEEDTDQNLERSKSLFQSIFYSHSKLTYREKLLFEILSLFPDGIHMSNIRLFFERAEYRAEINRITDKEINSLENKSLVDINGGFIKLQSILGRFAEYQFNKRNDEEKTTYYKTAYHFNEFFLLFLKDIYNENKTESLRIFDKNSNNLIKSLDYIALNDSYKEEKLSYVLLLCEFCGIIEQPNKIYEKISEIKEFFKDVENGILALETSVISLQYYEGKFESAYYDINLKLPLNQINIIDNTSNVGKSILSSAFSIYSFKNGMDVLLYYIDKQLYYTSGRLAYILYILGEYNAYQLLQKKDDYFLFEILLNKSELVEERVIEYLKGLYKKQYIEIMQCNYILSKLGHVDQRTINKLVVTNPYTLGLRNLMLAFIEVEYDKAKELFEKAIDQLEHIQYHHVEAIYYYSKYLKDRSLLDESNYWFVRGLKIAQQNQYRYLIHKFNKLEADQLDSYNDINIQSELMRDIEELINNVIKNRN